MEQPPPPSLSSGPPGVCRQSYTHTFTHAIFTQRPTSAPPWSLANKALFVVATVFFASAGSDTVALAQEFMVSTSHTAVFSEAPESIHTKYSVNKQQVNKCTGRTSLSNMATLDTQQLYPYNCGKLYTCGSDSGVNSHSIILTCLQIGYANNMYSPFCWTQSLG